MHVIGPYRINGSRFVAPLSTDQGEINQGVVTTSPRLAGDCSIAASYLELPPPRNRVLRTVSHAPYRVHVNWPRDHILST